jgi:hypothetical protein
MISHNDLIDYISRSTVIAVSIVVPTNIASLAIAYFLSGNRARSDVIDILIIMLAFIAIADIAIGFILKRKSLAPILNAGGRPESEVLWQAILKISILIGALCSAIPLYGLVLAFFGAKIEVTVGFALVSLIGFMILRVRPRDFEKLNVGV